MVTPPKNPADTKAANDAAKVVREKQKVLDDAAKAKAKAAKEAAHDAKKKK